MANKKAPAKPRTRRKNADPSIPAKLVDYYTKGHGSRGAEWVGLEDFDFEDDARPHLVTDLEHRWKRMRGLDPFDTESVRKLLDPTGSGLGYALKRAVSAYTVSTDWRISTVERLLEIVADYIASRDELDPELYKPRDVREAERWKEETNETLHVLGRVLDKASTSDRAGLNKARLHKLVTRWAHIARLQIAAGHSGEQAGVALHSLLCREFADEPKGSPWKSESARQFVPWFLGRVALPAQRSEVASMKKLALEVASRARAFGVAADLERENMARPRGGELTKKGERFEQHLDQFDAAIRAHS